MTRSTLESLSRFSDLPDLQFLVSDNCSGDHTWSAIQSVSPAFGGRLQAFRQEVNLGFRGNLAFLAGKAEAKFIWFIGIGETIAVDSLDALINFLKSTNAVCGTVGGEVSTGIMSSGNELAIGDTFGAIGLAPYSETVSLNILRTQECVTALGAGEGLTASYWPHLEVSLRLLDTSPQSVAFEVADTLVCIAENHDGWWFDRPNAYELLLSQAALLEAYSHLFPRFPWLGSRLEGIRKYQIVELILRMRVAGNRPKWKKLPQVLTKSKTTLLGLILITVFWVTPWSILRPLRAAAKLIQR